MTTRDAIITLLLNQPELIGVVVVFACKAITVCFPPPRPDSFFGRIWPLIEKGALDIGWAVNRFRAGMTAIPVLRADADAAKQTLRAADIPIVKTPAAARALAADKAG